MSHSQPVTDPADSGPRPRRVTVRYRCAPATIGKLYVNSDQEFQSAWVQNLSETGVGFTLSRPVDVAAFIVIHIKSNDLHRSFELPAQVVHCTRQPHGDWQVGCELITPLSADDLDQLL